MKSSLPRKDSDKPLILRSIVGVLLVVIGLAGIYWYDEYHDEYRGLLSAVRSHELSSYIENGDAYADLNYLSHEFDGNTNEVYLMKSEPPTDQQELLGYQIDYYFYPTYAEEIPYIPWVEMQDYLMGRTHAGDIVCSVLDLGLDPEFFDARNSLVSGQEHFSYLRK